MAQEANPDDVLNTIRTMIRSNQVIMFGKRPDDAIAKALGMEIVPISGYAWTIMNEKRPDYVPLSPSAYLASQTRTRLILSRNVYLRYLFRQARNRSLAESSLSEKSAQGWYPWRRSTT